MARWPPAGFPRGSPRRRAASIIRNGLRLGWWLRWSPLRRRRRWLRRRRALRRSNGFFLLFFPRVYLRPFGVINGRHMPDGFFFPFGVLAGDDHRHPRVLITCHFPPYRAAAQDQPTALIQRHVGQRDLHLEHARRNS